MTLFSFFVFFLDPDPDLDQLTRKKLKTRKTPNHIKINKGAMRGVNVVAMEELSEEAIAAARSRRMRER